MMCYQTIFNLASAEAARVSCRRIGMVSTSSRAGGKRVADCKDVRACQTV